MRRVFVFLCHNVSYFIYLEKKKKKTTIARRHFILTTFLFLVHKHTLSPSIGGSPDL